jgi:hypothetical protein
MAHDSKRGFFSSLFGNRKQKEQEETAELESRHRLEERIQQILAERVVVPEVVVQENHAAALAAALMTQEEEVEPEVELLPISASVLSRRKAPVSADFLLSSLDVQGSYAANQR